MHSKVVNFLLGSHLLIDWKQMTKQSLSTPRDNCSTGEQKIQKKTCTMKLTYCEINEASSILLNSRGHIMTSLITLLLLSYISPEHDRISFLDFIVNISGVSFNRVKIICLDTSLQLCFHTLAKILSLKLQLQTP